MGEQNLMAKPGRRFIGKPWRVHPNRTNIDLQSRKNDLLARVIDAYWRDISESESSMVAVINSEMRTWVLPIDEFDREVDVQDGFRIVECDGTIWEVKGPRIASAHMTWVCPSYKMRQNDR